MDIWYFELWCAGENYYIKAVQYKSINTIIIIIIIISSSIGDNMISSATWKK